MIPTNTTIAIKVNAPAAGSSVAVFMTSNPPEAHVAGGLSDAQQRVVDRLIQTNLARGKANEVVFGLVDGPSTDLQRLFVVGLGASEKVTPESIRQAAGALLRAARKQRLDEIAVVAPGFPDASEALATGLLLAAFDYREYKGSAAKKDSDNNHPGTLTVNILTPDQQAPQAVQRAKALCDGQNFARTIASRPGNVINPPALAKISQQLAREAGLRCRIFDEKQLARMGMGGILAVGAGSIDTPPRMIVLEYKGKKAADRRPLLVVGKAITFDTGGISIKPAEKMGRMIFDKCGGMAVLGFMYAIARLKLPVNVVGILASAENAISAKAYRPGDIVTMYNKVTVEVTNTDAEGRLVLGDALAWGIETYNPSAALDLATLTGGVITALGKSMAGVMSNSDALVAELSAASARAGEKFWRLPLFDEHRDLLKSDHADIVNSGGREAHPIQGAAFLSYFVPSDSSIPWAHLDIAGVADAEKDLPYYDKGATGWGVRTLVEWAASKA